MRVDADLHCHSTASDGALAPAEVVRRAVERGVSLLALTDHDQLSGLEEARAAATASGIEFVCGVEVSVTWRGITVHVVGLRVDPVDRALQAGLEHVRGGRLRRAQKIGEALAAVGIAGSYEGAVALAENPSMVSRTHFARFLVQQGVVADTRAVFRRFLVQGKPGYVPHQWAQLADALRWIRGAGGIAVLAHPGRYGLSAAAMGELVEEFKSGGGSAIETVTGSHSRGQYSEFGELARHYGLAVSRGSDFHSPDEGAEFGSLPGLDDSLTPVWRLPGF
jgi:hypothetical protein